MKWKSKLYSVPPISCYLLYYQIICSLTKMWKNCNIAHCRSRFFVVFLLLLLLSYFVFHNFSVFSCEPFEESLAQQWKRGRGFYFFWHWHSDAVRPTLIPIKLLYTSTHTFAEVYTCNNPPWIGIHKCKHTYTHHYKYTNKQHTFCT